MSSAAQRFDNNVQILREALYLYRASLPSASSCWWRGGSWDTMTRSPHIGQSLVSMGERRLFIFGILEYYLKIFSAKMRWRWRSWWDTRRDWQLLTQGLIHIQHNPSGSCNSISSIPPSDLLSSEIKQENKNWVDRFWLKQGINSNSINYPHLNWNQLIILEQNSIGSVIEKQSQSFPSTGIGSQTDIFSNFCWNLGRRQYHAVTRGWIANEVFRRVHPEGKDIRNQSKSQFSSQASQSESSSAKMWANLLMPEFS